MACSFAERAASILNCWATFPALTPTFLSHTVVCYQFTRVVRRDCRDSKLVKMLRISTVGCWAKYIASILPVLKGPGNRKNGEVRGRAEGNADLQVQHGCCPLELRSSDYIYKMHTESGPSASYHRLGRGSWGPIHLKIYTQLMTEGVGEAFSSVVWPLVRHPCSYKKNSQPSSCRQPWWNWLGHVQKKGMLVDRGYLGWWRGLITGGTKGE